MRTLLTYALCGVIFSPWLSNAAVISPEIQDEKVTFRMRAPQAREVLLRGQWTRETPAFARDENGLWAITLEGVPPGVWEYSFAVDKLNVLDSLNPNFKPQREPSKSILHIPSVPPAPWDFQDIPHGTVHQHPYFSKVLGRAREFCVYTPPGYEGGRGKLPLLVLQHGSGDNQRTWTDHGKAHWILDNLLAQKRAVPMIVVMLDGHPLGMVSREDPTARERANLAFQRELFEDVLPIVEKTYRIKSGAGDRAIAGLSMGGGHSLTTGLALPLRFGWVGAFSASVPVGDTARKLTAEADTLNSRLRLLWIACGKEDFLLERNQQFIALLKEQDIHHQFLVTEGDHSWPIWRRYLTDFAPLLFRK